MEVAMAIAVIAAGLFIALGVFFIICSLKSIKSSQKNETRIKGLEDSLDNMEKLISERTNYLAAKLEESSPVRAVEAPPENTRECAEQVSAARELDEISLEDLFDDDFEDWLMEEVAETQEPEPEPMPAPEPEPVRPAPKSEPAPVTAYPPSNHHMGYDVGKSGRKYTASELEDLIRA
ncbi:MAG: hypothetical protein ACI4KL_06985 [Lentihominibacter sp.]